MDCETFDSALVDALYDELDEVRTRAMERHAEGCPACAAKLSEMRATRDRAPRSYLIEEPPSGFENRILAAVDEALSKKAPIVKEEPKGGAKIFAFVARPQFAIAAAFLLLLGGAVFLTSQSSMKADSTAMKSAPAGQARGGEGQGAKAEENAPVATATPTVAASAVAQLDPAPPPAAAPTMAYNAPAEAKKVAGPACDLPKLEALAKTNAEADLQAARCIAQTQGCKAAVTRLDNAAKRNAGTENGSRATLEAARCYESMGDMTNARSRYAKLTRDNYVADEANYSLNNLGNAQTPPATATARPAGKKAAPPQSGSPPSNVNVLE